ncbi:TolC family protein [Pseudothermotoga sp. U03pept]|uniref:TolC family protein n=1 Tax=Pseudothermotoga sp. U03pept TaxID=3447012 RepID=UPI003EFCEE85
MRRIVLFVLLVPFLAYASFLDLVQAQLEKDSSYLSAVIKYKSAEFTRAKNKNFFIPYVGTKALSLETDFENYSLSIPLSITFENIAGFDLTISNTWNYLSKTDQWDESGWALTISRQLFSNFDITELENEKDYISAIWSLTDARNKVFVNLANDVFNYHYYTRKLEITKRKIEILQEQFESLQRAYEAGTASKEDIMQVQSNIYQMTNQLDQISQNLMSALTEYSTDTLNTMFACLERITSNLLSQQEAEKFILNRLDLKAQLMSVEIARRESERSYQQWLPNPTFSFSVKQDENSDKGFSLSLGFAFGYNIVDRGERDYNYNYAKNNYTLQQRLADEQLDNMKKSVQKAYLSIKIGESSKRVAELDLQLKKMEYERLLSASAFVSQSDLESAKLDLQDAEAELLKATYNLLIGKLSLLQACGYDLVELAGGK